MAEQGGAAYGERNTLIYRAYVVRRRTFAEIGREFGISEERAGQIVRKMREEQAPPDLTAVRNELLEIYRDSLRQAAELAAMDGAPVTAGKDGDVVRDPEHRGEDGDGRVVRDYGGRIAALKLTNETTAHVRKLLGLDAAEKVELSGAVRYELVGIDPADLT